MNKEKIIKLINNMRVKYRFLEKDLNKLENALEEAQNGNMDTNS